MQRTSHPEGGTKPRVGGLPRLALYQPDIPQNAGTLLRLAACLGLAVDVIGPCGFLWDDRRMRRAGMDYAAAVRVRHHSSFAVFETVRAGSSQRLVPLTTAGDRRLDDFAFAEGDIVMVGRESAGVPDDVAAAADIGLRIPMIPGVRSLNVALAATLAIGEALRQMRAFPA